MSASQRNKGNAGERELFKLLSGELGFVVKRNLSQARGGGADCIQIPGWSVECKRQEKLNCNAWWQQTLDQCGEGEEPILFYRQSRQPWQAIMRLSGINDRLYGDYTVILPFLSACMLIRETL